MLWSLCLVPKFTSFLGSGFKETGGKPDSPRDVCADGITTRCSEWDSLRADWPPLRAHCGTAFQKLLKGHYADGLLCSNEVLSGGLLYAGAELLWKSVCSCRCSDGLAVPASHIYIINRCTDDWISWLKPAASLQDKLARSTTVPIARQLKCFCITKCW